MGITAIIRQTAETFHLKVNEICGMSRKEEVVLARQVAMYLSWQKTDSTLEVIGKELGNRTPATVSWGYQRIAKSLNENPELRQKLEIINESL